MKCRIVDLGLTEYPRADYIQRSILTARQSNQSPNTILCAEFYSVFTIGRLGDYRNLLVDSDSLVQNGVKVYKTDRGGDVTYHGPGQLVFYPIINLADLKKDIRLYIRNLENTIIEFLRKYKINSYRIVGKTGVWIGGKKIAQIGIGVSKWTTYHGFSFNVRVDKRFFSMINPCGFKGAQIINLIDLLNFDIDMSDIKKKILGTFSKIFDLDLEYDYEPIPAMA